MSAGSEILCVDHFQYQTMMAQRASVVPFNHWKHRESCREGGWVATLAGPMFARRLPFFLALALLGAVKGLAQTAEVGVSGTPSTIGAMASMAGGLDDTSKAPDTLHYSASSLEYDDASRIFLLSGSAHLEYRRSILTADSIWYDLNAGLLEAVGTPSLKDPTIAPFQGRRMRYNLKTRSGQVLDGGSDDNGQHYRGLEVRRSQDKRLQVVDADYCECKGDSTEPDYYFASESMEIEPNNSAVAAPVVLNVENVPIVALPLAYFPLGKGRRSGLLTPKFGGDQLQGFFIKNAGAYWAINDYADEQVTSDLVEGTEGRFDNASFTSTTRYKVRYLLDGSVGWKQYLNQFGSAGSGWQADYTHSQELLPKPGKSTIKGEGHFVSSRTVRSDNALTSDEVLNQTANANLQWQYRWDNSSFVLLGNQQQNLSTGLLTRQLPSASFTSSGQLFPWIDQDIPLLPDWQYSYSAQGNRYDNRKADADTLTGRPSMLHYMGATQTASLTATHTLGYLRFTPQITANHYWTANSYASRADTVLGWHNYSDRYDPSNVFLWNTGVTAATDLYGIWMPQWGSFGGLRHTLTPSVGYTFYPHYDTSYSFVANPTLSQSIGQNRAQLLTLGLGQKLDAKIYSADTSGKPADKTKAKKGTPYSLLSANTSVSYDLEKTLRPWSDIVSTASTGLLSLSLSGGMTHTLYDSWGGDSARIVAPILKSWNVSLRKTWSFSGGLADGFQISPDSLESKGWNASADLSSDISSTRANRSTFRTTRTQSGGLSLTLSPTRAWSATYTARYNFDEGDFASQVFAFKRQIGCWDLDFGWTPVGPARGWTFQVKIRDLPDVKVQANSTSIRKTKSSTTSE